MFMGDRLRDLRKKKGLTQQALANLVNVTKVSISCYESGNRVPNLDTFSDLVDILDTTSDFLLGKDRIFVSKDNEENKISVSNEEISILKEFNKHRDLYKFLKSDPKRSVEYIVKKIK